MPSGARIGGAGGGEAKGRSMNGNPKKTVFGHLARIGRALGHAHRLEILELLGQGERDVEALAALTGLSLANASQHLQRLRAAGLVVSRREGRHVRYALADGAIVDLVAALRTVAERNLADVARAVARDFRDPEGLEPVTRRELLRRLRRGEVTVVDVRPAEEYAAGHLPGAINIPRPDLARRLGELPRDREIVAYCRGPYCAPTFEAVAAFRRAGLAARLLEDGFPEWRAAGLPVEVGAGRRSRPARRSGAVS